MTDALLTSTIILYSGKIYGHYEANDPNEMQKEAKRLLEIIKHELNNDTDNNKEKKG